METATGPDSVVRFGVFEINLRTRELYRDGSIVKLRGHPIDVLAVLVQHPGELVTRDVLQKELWPDSTFVSFEQILNNSIVKLRNALGDRADSPQYIETLPRLGYRFIAPIIAPTSNGRLHLSVTPTAQDSDGDEGAPQGRQGSRKLLWLLAGLAPILIIAGLLIRGNLRHSSLANRQVVHRIAVLPLTNISADPQQEYFADGMTEQLITELAQIKAWEVISRTSVMRYKGTNKSLPRIAKDLSADWIIEGTVQRSGGRVRITAQLIDARRDAHLWSGSFERDLSDVLLLQNEIARAVSVQARLTLTAQESLRTGSAKKVNPEAYDAFLTGRYLLERGSSAEAASEFEKAIAKDPQFALAYAYLYEADGNLTFFQDLPFSDRALHAARRAMEIDSTLAEAHVAAGDYAFYGEWDWSACDGEFRRAIELDPNSTDAAVHLALCLRALGRMDDAVAELQRGLHLDPVSPWLNVHLLRTLFEAHRSDEALAQIKRVYEILPDSGQAYACAADIFESTGRDSDAIEAHRKADRLSDFSLKEADMLERAATSGGLHRYWQERLNILVERSKRINISPMQFADLYARTGEPDKAIVKLEEAYRQHIPRMVWIKTSRLYDPLRADSRFRAILARMRHPA